jgi:hypothetical protein
MVTCTVCHALADNGKKRGRRLYLEFTPAELRTTALVNECQSCIVLLKGILLMQDDTWSFTENVSKVYGYGLATKDDTLTLEVYFIERLPRVVLEFFYTRHESRLYWRRLP